MKKTGKLLIWLCLLLFAVIGAGLIWLYTALPRTEGRIALPGLNAPVTINRDKHGIPYIMAQTQRDAHFALGFVHAQDRFWQMDFQRLLGAGRLSEILGPVTRENDIFMRRIGLYRLAKDSLDQLDPPARAMVSAYTEGVNAWLKTRSGALPPEYYLLRYRPEPWRPQDSMVWGRLMAMYLARNWREEVLRSRLEKKLGPEKTKILFPDYPDGAPLTQAGLAIPNPLVSASASNAWGLSGNHTSTGKPILANDPHLRLRAPGTWYLARLETPGQVLAGATVAGVPFMVLGRNDHIAWGITSSETDSQDWFIEKIDPSDPKRYLTPAGPMPFETREEILKIRGVPDEKIILRATRHGPVLSDGNEILQALASDGHVLALSSPALRKHDKTANALYWLNQARNWQDFEAALRDWHSPHQNIFYADANGNIGFAAPALLPVRKAGDGRKPVPGWTGDYDWTGYRPFTSLPRSFNPAKGYIANANNPTRSLPDSGDRSRNRTPGFRAMRLNQAIEASPQHSMESTAGLQNDVRSEMAAVLLPLMLKHPLTSRQGKQAASLLSEWDFTMARHRPEPMIFNNWMRQITRRIFADELGDLFPAWYGLNPRSVMQVLKKETHWCDNKKTAAAETCAGQVAKALDDALAQLASRFGTDMTRWRWGDVHEARFDHPAFGKIPGLNWLGNVRLPSDGGIYTLNRGGMRIANDRSPFAHIHGPGLRAIYDLSDLENSHFMIAPGQSGHLFSPHYRSLAARWQHGDYIRLNAKEGGGEILTLVPQEQP